MTVRLGQKNYLDVIERAVSSGETVLLENLEESIDPVLDPLLGRNTIKRGRAIKLGDKEIDYSPQFRLILHTKLGNPHYKPETQAQTTLINFTVTRDGLEDQLLAAVVGKERKDLEETKAALTNFFQRLGEPAMSRSRLWNCSIRLSALMPPQLPCDRKSSGDVTFRSAG